MNTRKLNNLTIAIAAAAALALAAACSMEGAPDSKTGGGLKAVRFTSDNVALVQDKTVNTARMAGAAWETTDLIGIYMIGADGGLTAGNIKEYGNNRQYKPDTAATESDFSAVGGDTIYYPASGEVKFIAYYPYTGTIDNFKLPVIVAADQSGQLATDVLYARKTDGNYDTDTTDAVDLKFDHSLVKLEFEIVKEDASVETSLEGLAVTITNQAITGTMNLATGKVETTNSVDNTITAKTATNGKSAEAIVFPATDNTSVRFKFENSEHEIFTGTVPSPDSGWLTGNKYTYTVTLKKNEAAITGKVNAWGTGAGGDVTADAEE